MTYLQVRNQAIVEANSKPHRNPVADVEGQLPAADVADRHRRALIGSGIVLLTASLLNGFVIGIVPVQRVAVSAHVSGLIGSSFLIALGAIWPLLRVSSRASAAAAFLAVHGFFGGWLVLFVAATSTLTGPAAHAAGRAWMQQALRLGNLTVVLALFGLCAIVLRGVLARPSKILMPRDRSTAVDLIGR
jgi:hypothetical protein